jgi:hypothetical protein
MKQASWFIDCGMISDESTASGNRQKVMDWEQDYNIIVPAINRVANKEVRAEEYMHWWTFMGYFREIGDCFFTQVVNIRQKLNKGEKLEKWEKEFLHEHREQVILKNRLTEAQENEINELFGGEK